MSNTRTVKVEVGQGIRIGNLSETLVYYKQAFIKTGDFLYLFKGENLLHHVIEVTTPPEEPKAIFVVKEIKYKSRFHRYFKIWLKTPIVYIDIECLGIMK